MRNPFIPSRSPICRAAETFLIFAMAAAGFAAAAMCLLGQMARI